MSEINHWRCNRSDLDTETCRRLAAMMPTKTFQPTFATQKIKHRGTEDTELRLKTLLCELRASVFQKKTTF